jgi:hypothetical protein
MQPRWGMSGSPFACYSVSARPGDAKTDDASRQAGPGVLDHAQTIIADAHAPEAFQPTDRPLHDPTHFTQATTVFAFLLPNLRLNAQPAQQPTGGVVVVPRIGDECVRQLLRTARFAGWCWSRITSFSARPGRALIWCHGHRGWSDWGEVPRRPADATTVWLHPDEGRLIWSLSLPQVAATPAAAIVAFQSKNAAGVRLIDEPVLNTMLVLVVVTSILGPVLTERFGRQRDWSCPWPGWSPRPAGLDAAWTEVPDHSVFLIRPDFTHAILPITAPAR